MTAIVPLANFDKLLDSFALARIPDMPIPRLSLLVDGRWITGELPVIQDGKEKDQLAWPTAEISNAILLKKVTIKWDSDHIDEVDFMVINRSHVSAFEWVGDEPSLLDLETVVKNL